MRFVRVGVRVGGVIWSKGDVVFERVPVGVGVWVVPELVGVGSGEFVVGRRGFVV